MAALRELHDRQCVLFLFCNWAGVGRLFYALRTCPSDMFGDAQVQFDLALRSSLETRLVSKKLGEEWW